MNLSSVEKYIHKLSWCHMHSGLCTVNVSTHDIIVHSKATHNVIR